MNIDYISFSQIKICSIYCTRQKELNEAGYVTKLHNLWVTQIEQERSIHIWVYTDQKVENFKTQGLTYGYILKVYMYVFRKWIRNAIQNEWSNMEDHGMKIIFLWSINLWSIVLKINSPLALMPATIGAYKLCWPCVKPSWTFNWS